MPLSSRDTGGGDTLLARYLEYLEYPEVDGARGMTMEKRRRQYREVGRGIKLGKSKGRVIIIIGEVTNCCMIVGK